MKNGTKILVRPDKYEYNEPLIALKDMGVGSLRIATVGASASNLAGLPMSSNEKHLIVSCRLLLE